MTQTFEACAPGVASELDNPDLQMLPYNQGFSRWLDNLSRRRHVAGPVEDFPPQEQDILGEQGILSLLVLPVWAQGRWLGFVGLDETKAARRWTKEEISFLQTASDMIGSFFEARNIREELRTGEEYMRSVVEGAIDIIYTLSPSTGAFEYVSPSWRALLGHDPDEVVGRSFQEFVHPDDLDKCRDFFEEVIRTGMSRTGFEFRVIHANRSTRFYTTNAATVLHGNGKASRFVGIARDITAQREFEQLKEDVDRILKHELKTPLNAILALPGAMALDDNLTAEQREDLLLVEESARRMLQTINLSADLYKLESGIYHYQPESVDLLEMLEHLLRNIKPLAARRSISLSLTLDNSPLQDGDSLFLPGEESLLNSVFFNLLVNAVEASPPGEAVDVDVETGDPVLVRVENQGGVPGEIRNRFFREIRHPRQEAGHGTGNLQRPAHGGGHGRNHFHVQRPWPHPCRSPTSRRTPGKPGRLEPCQSRRRTPRSRMILGRASGPFP